MAKMHFPYVVPIQMRWKDVDQMQHVNNTKLLTYCEEARIRLLNEDLKWDYQATGIVVARVEANYLKPLYYPNEIVVKIACIRMGNTSMDVRQMVCSAKDETKVYMDSKIVLVTLNPKTGEPVMVPDYVREKIIVSEPENDQEVVT